MMLVDDAGEAYPRIDHSPWNGCTLADFVMPFFLFIVGVAIALALKVEMLQKGLKEVGVLRDVRSSSYHKLNPTSTGLFPNHIVNLEDKTMMKAITQAVLDHKADIGIIFDTDVDRSASMEFSGCEFNRNRLIGLMTAIVLEEDLDHFSVLG